MIVTCDECDTRYVVPSASIGDDGRRVRCTNCGNEWYQEPNFDDEDNGEDINSFSEELARLHDDEDLEPIPDAVKPLPEGSAVPALKDRNAAQESEPNANFVGRITGFSAAAVVFLVIIGVILMLQNTLVKLWPNTAVIYDMAGKDIRVTGEKLLFKGVSAKAVQTEGYVNVNITGSLINLEKEESGVPYVQISLIEEGGSIADRWIIEDMSKSIGAEGEIAFEATYPDVDSSVKEVKIELVPFYTAPPAGTEPVLQASDTVTGTHEEPSDHDSPHK